MLQSIREHTQGWIAGTIITIVIITFALWGIHSYFTGSSNNSVVAEVNNVDVSKEQLAVAYERLRRQAQIQYGSNYIITSKDEAGLKSRALQALVEVEVLKQASTAEGFGIFNAQMDNYIENLPDFQIDGRFSVERFKEILASTLLSTSEFFDLIKTSLLIEQPKLGMMFTSFATPDETNYTMALVNQERDFDYITVPYQFFLTTQPISVSPDKIKAYYEEHKAEFRTPDQVSVEYVALSLKELAAAVQVSDAALKIFYNENLNAYTQPTAWKLQALAFPIADKASPDDLNRIETDAKKTIALWQKGEPFSKLKAKFPADNKINESEWVTLNKIPSEWQKPVAQLVKANQYSSLFKTSNQFVILKAVEVQDPKIQAFDEVASKVKEAYAHQRAEEKFTELRDQLSSLTYEHPDTLIYASKALNLPVKTSEQFTKEKPGQDISQYKKVRDTAFSNDVLNLQNNSDVISINPEMVIVLRLKNHVVSTLLPLQSVNTQIEEKLKAEEAEAKTAQFAESLKVKLEAGEDPKKVADANHLVWKNPEYLGRYSTKVEPAVLDMAFRLPNPKVLSKAATYGVVRLTTGYAVVALRGVKDGAALSDQQYSVFAEQVQNSQGLLEYELYKQSQIKQAKIKIEK